MYRRVCMCVYLFQDVQLPSVDIFYERDKQPWLRNIKKGYLITSSLSEQQALEVAGLTSKDGTVGIHTFSLSLD